MSLRLPEEVPLWLRELCDRLQSDDKAMLTEVNLNIRRLNRSMMMQLCHVLRESTDLRSINLTSSLIDRVDVPSRQVLGPLIQLVLSSPTSLLRILHLSYNRLSGPLEGIGYSLSTNQSLLELHLDHNRLDCGTVVELAAGLRHNQTLRVLQLSSNLIGDRGARHLARALVDNRTLQTLGLMRNFVGQDGADALWHTLQKHQNTSLTRLDLQNNPDIADATLGWIATLCRANLLGRSILLHETDAVPGLVAPVLARARRAPSVLYLFLQEMHSNIIFPSNSTMAETINNNFSIRHRPTKKARCDCE